MKFWSNSEIPMQGPLIPEKRLLAAVLQRAITDFLTGEEDVSESARSWLIDEEPEEAPLTFAFVCEALDLDPASLRKAVVMQSHTYQAMNDRANYKAVNSKEMMAPRHEVAL